MKESSQFSDAMWTRVALDHEMKILKITNLDDKLFFGKNPVPGLIISEAAGAENCRQAEIIAGGIRKAFKEKRNTCFFYHSSYGCGNDIPVCVHTQYNDDRTVCLYLTSLHTEDMEQIQKSVIREMDVMSQTIFNNIPVGIEIYDCDGKLTDINSQGLEDIGACSREEILGLSFFGNPCFTEDIKHRLHNGENVRFCLDYDFSLVEPFYKPYKKGIAWIDSSVSIIRDYSGKITNYIILSQDVTEKLQNEEILRSNQHKTEIALKASDIMFWEFDVRKKQFLSENEPMNGYDKSKPISISQYIESTHPDNWKKLNELVRQMSNGEEFSFNFDIQVRIPGSYGWQYCSVNGLPYERSPDGKVIKYVGIRKNNTLIHKRKLLQDKILNNIPLSIHIKDVENDYRYIFCNDESKRLFGTSEEKTTYDVMDKEEVERIRKTDLEVFKTGKPYWGLEHVVLKDGRNYDTIVQKSIIDDNDKRLLLSIRWDQSLQNELKRRSKLFSLSLEAMNAFTWFYEPDKEQVSFGDGFDKMGRKASEINTLETFISCMHPDDVRPYIDSLKDIVAGESGIWKSETRLDLSGNGNYQWWEAHGILETRILNDVPYKYIFGMSVCIEPHKQTELTLLKNKDELDQLIRQNELILNNSNSGLAYITTDYMVQWENISICSESLSFEAYKKGELCYRSAHNRTSPCEDCVLQRAFASSQPEKIQFVLENNRMVEVFATPVFKEDGAIDGIVIRVDDITERQQMIGELKQAKMLAEQSDKLKSAFLANMSHEIRTPLNAIIGFSELLMNTSEETERDEYMSIINNNNELLLKLINDILDLSKIEAGSIEFRYEEFDLAEYFNTMAVTMRQRITNSNVRLISVNPYPVCKVNLDKNRVAQLMTNYLTNAIKYTPKGFIEVGYECSDEGIRFYVKDSGIGISEEKKEKVFHRFAKLDEFAQGTGLGLSICKAIAESMGGSVGFESQYGEGSLFWAFLPCEPEVRISPEACSMPEHTASEATTVTETNLETEVSVNRKTILVAEDIQSNFLLLSAMLKKQYNLLHALNGQQAVEMAQNNPVDLLLMDMKMPVMNGLEATEEIRKFNIRLPIVALTAHAFEADRMAALAAGCNEFLVKPVNKKLLMNVLQKYCPVSRR